MGQIEHPHSHFAICADKHSMLQHIDACTADIPLESLLDSEDIDSSFDSPSADVASASKDDDMEAIATESSSSRPAVAVRPTDAAIVQMDADAASQGFGKAYAAFGGGREGLEACAASESCLVMC